MATSKKITAMPSLGGAQVPSDLIPAIKLAAAPANQNVQTTLNDLFSTVTKNITDGAVRWQAVTAPAVSAASTGAIYFSIASQKFQVSQNGSAYASLVLAGAITTSGLTQSTARLLGRTTASTGAVEEITVGSGLTLSGGSLTATGTSPAGVTGDYQINNAGAFGAGVIAQGSTGRVTITPTASAATGTSYLSLVTPADTLLPASTEAVGVWVAGSSGSTVTRNWAGPGSFAQQREIVVTAPTYTSTGGVTTITTAATLAISGAPIETATVGIPNALALWVQTGNSRVSLASGTSAIPGFQLGAKDTGFFTSGALICLSSSGVPAIGWSGAFGTTVIGSPYSIAWGSSGLTSPDLSLFRSAASVLRLGNGDTTSGAGQLLVAASGTTATGQVTILSAATNRNALYVQGANDSTFAPIVGVVVPTTTNTATTHVISLRARSTGAPTSGFGGTINLSAQTSSANDVQAAEIAWSWTTATHGTRTSQLAFSLVANATTINVLTMNSSGLTISQRGLYLTQTGGGATYTGFIAPLTLTGGDSPYTMPVSYPAVAGYMLSSDTFGTLSWVPDVTGADILETQIFS